MYSSAAPPSGTVNTYAYNGLGLRVTKTDSAGSYAYVCDGTSPGSPVLTDGTALYTPGLSENRGGASRYYSNDQMGNLWTIDGSSKGQLDYQDTTGFGTLVAQAGSGSVFGYGGGNGCQTDADTGLILMGHRYYDTRIGRFITQDPAGAGNNWYGYADNSPINEIDPSGLDAVISLPIGSSPMGSPGYSNIAGAASEGAFYDNEVLTKYTITDTWVQDCKQGVDGLFHWVDRQFSHTYSISADPIAGDNLGNLFQALAPYAPKRVAKAAGALANLVAARAAAKAAEAALKSYAEKAAASAAWKSMGDATARGLTRSLGAEALGTLGVAGGGIIAEGIGAWSAGWEIGTAISNAPVGPGGQTVTDFWSDQLSNSGSWMQQNTSFGH